ncbi:globin family protein [Piscinibacter sp. XHJ-5]|uniref:globin family protein n=1 Tax=Piscinibacter sp. XHJ-5 TaxID=3037797 RepID=UPI00245347A1|nr:globin family protein [Piscinibacter sp. XHJ-5]
MTPLQITLVRRSFDLVASIAPQAAALFYANLFEADPALRRLFRGDIAQQGARLMAMLGQAVRMLDRPVHLAPALRSLGARHGGYGVEPQHYRSVGAALLKTLSQGLGEAFTPEVEQAWIAVYGVVTHHMLEGQTAAAVA